MKKVIAIASIAAFLVSASTASAIFFDDDVEVKNSNSAYVKNDVEVKADSGDNYAGGSEGGNGGNGGAVSGFGNNNNDSQGGAGGDAGIGGEVSTGSATADSWVNNNVNSNRTRVNSCGCDESLFDGGDVEVKNRNRATVKNYVDVKADSGDNKAKGSEGGNGGDAGSVGGFGNNGNENDGGAGGNGDAGGLVTTGNTKANSDIVNVVNRNLTRVRR